MRFQSSLVSLGERERNTGRARNQSRYAVLLLLLLLLLLFSKQHVPYATRYTRPGSCLNHFSRTENDRQQQDADQPSGSSSRLEARARESCASSRASTTMILWTHSIPFNKHKEKRQNVIPCTIRSWTARGDASKRAPRVVSERSASTCFPSNHHLGRIITRQGGGPRG